MSLKQEHVIIKGVEFKKCSKCERLLLATTKYFNKDKLRYDGLFPYCKECRGHHYKTIPIVADGNKTCAKCNRELPARIEYFHKDKNASTGFYCYCRECRGYQFLKIVPQGYKYCICCEKVFLATENHFFKRTDNLNGFTSTCKECHGRISKTNYFNSIAERKAKNKQYRRTQHGRDIARQIFQRYKTKKKDLVADLTKEQWEQCLIYFDYKDAYTGLPMNIISQDHVIPLSKNGIYSVNNIIPCEKSINSSKGNRPFETWYRKQSFYSEDRETKILKYLHYNNRVQQLAFTI